ncbi:hypothetical protein CL622_02165 [archaeon]|nr:hypothetical protein [archaeon]
MVLKIQNRADFLGRFLSPINKLSESVVLKVSDKKYTAITSSSDGTLIVYCTYKQNNELDDNISLNIPDISKLIKVLSCISTDSIELNFNNNNIEYKSPNVSFKYHLLEDGIIEVPAVNITKIKNIDFNFRFTVTTNTINQLIKGSTFTTDTNKIYFNTKDGKVYGSLTDNQRHNVDSYSQEVSDSFAGEPLASDLALSFENIRMISGIRFDKLNVLVNPELNVFLFDIDLDDIKINIISSGYIN